MTWSGRAVCFAILCVFAGELGVAPANADTPAVYGATYGAAPVAPAVVAGTKTLSYPDNLQMVMLGYRLTGQEPPVQDWAASEYAIKNADEFSRDAKLKTEIARLHAVYQSASDIGIVTLKTDSNFGEYDSAAGGFYLMALAPGTFFTFQADEMPRDANIGAVELHIDNSDQAQLWPMTPDEAKALLQKTRNSRSVDLVLTIALERGEQRSAGMAIYGTIKDITIAGDRYGQPQPLAQFKVKQ